MQLQGASEETTDALSRGELAEAELPEAERVLLEFVELLTKHSYRNTAANVQRVRDAGWTEEQIGEAVYVTAMFAMFNRVADAFGLQDPAYREAVANGESAPQPAEHGKPDA